MALWRECQSGAYLAQVHLWKLVARRGNAHCSDDDRSCAEDERTGRLHARVAALIRLATVWHAVRAGPETALPRAVVVCQRSRLVEPRSFYYTGRQEVGWARTSAPCSADLRVTTVYRGQRPLGIGQRELGRRTLL